MHKRAYIFGQASDLLGQVFDQLKSSIDIALNLHQYSASVQVIMRLPESKRWLEDLHAHDMALVWQALCNAGGAPASRTGPPPAQPL